MIFIGIDNGVTGAIGVLSDDKVEYYPMPVKSEQSYTKTKQNITRIDKPALVKLLAPYALGVAMPKCMIERPMVNPLRWKASASALRALEATLIALEELGISIQYCDSKEWQHTLLPKNMGNIVINKAGKPKRKVDPAELKKASLDIASRLFPSVKDLLDKDGDALLIAEHLRRTYK